MKIHAILNREEGMYLEAANIISLAVNEIPVDHHGNTAFAILAYPSPGAGYKLALFNDKDEAFSAFEKLVAADEEFAGKTYEIQSLFIEHPVETEVTELSPECGDAKNTTIIKEGEAAEIDGIEYKVDEDGGMSITNLGDNSVTIEGIGNGEINITAEEPSEDEKTANEVVEEQIEQNGPVYG